MSIQQFRPVIIAFSIAIFAFLQGFFHRGVIYLH
jgi:hypothetical protein